MRERTLSPRRCISILVAAATSVVLAGSAALGTPQTSSVDTSSFNPSQGLREKLVFSRQICDSDTKPCWEIVVSDARENHERVVAGPYPRKVWDDHFVANWAPDGHSVIFMANLGHGQKIWRVRANGSHLHAVFTPPAGTFLDDGPAFTPDGRHIIFTRCCPKVSGYALWSINAHGRHLTQVTSEAVPAGIDGPSDNLPQVSPNGHDVAYHRNVVDPKMGVPLGSRISIAPLRTGTFTDITDPTALSAGIPNWSPTGSRLVFIGGTGDGGIDIWRVNRDGTHLTQLTDNGASLDPSYTPDGSIIFSRFRNDGTSDLFVMGPHGNNPRRVKATKGTEQFPHLIQSQD